MLWIVTGRMTPQTFSFVFLWLCAKFLFCATANYKHSFLSPSYVLVRQAAVLLEQERQHEMAKMQPRSMPTVTPIRGEFKRVLNNTKCYIMNLKYIFNFFFSSETAHFRSFLFDNNSVCFRASASRCQHVTSSETQSAASSWRGQQRGKPPLLPVCSVTSSSQKTVPKFLLKILKISADLLINYT